MAAVTIGTPTGLPANVDLRIRQGSTVTWALAYRETTPDGATVPNTFTGWSARCQLRSRIGGDVWLALNVGDGLTLDAAANKLTVRGLIPHTVTGTTVWNERTVGVWDLELVAEDGTVTSLAAGRVLVEHDVTRDA